MSTSKEKNKEYYRKNKEHLNNKAKLYYQLHKKEIGISKKKYAANNREKRLNYMKSFYNNKKESGLCTSCGKPRLNSPSKTLCIDCRHLRNKQTQDRRDTRKINKVCSVCGKSRYKGIYCHYHYEKKQKSRLCRFQRLTKNKTCTRCGKNQSVGEVLTCEICTLKILAKRHLDSRNRWQELKVLFNIQEGHCIYSGRKITLGIDAQIDHRISKKLGGTNTIENLQWVHEKVNMAKWEYSEEEFILLIKDIYKHVNK